MLPEPDYIVRVPDAYRIAGLDASRWLLVSPAWLHNPVEGHPITQAEASDLFGENAADIGRPWMTDVRRDLLTLQAAAAIELPTALDVAVYGAPRRPAVSERPALLTTVRIGA